MSFDAHENVKSSRITPSSINLIVQRHAEMAGLSPEDWSPKRLFETPAGERW